MKELFQALLYNANRIYPMRGVSAGWCTVGTFLHKKDIYAFIITGDRGTIRRVDIKNEENDWFGVIKTNQVFTAIVFNGVKYEYQPTLF